MATTAMDGVMAMAMGGATATAIEDVMATGMDGTTALRRQQRQWQWMAQWRWQ